MTSQKQPTTKKIPDMDPKEIWIAMQRAEVSQKEIAAALDVTRQMVHIVIKGRAVSHRVRAAIADAIGMDLKRIWPSTYLNPDGTDRSGRPSIH